MWLTLQQQDEVPFSDRLRDAPAATAVLVREVIAAACQHRPYPGRAGGIARIERLISAEAWAEAALALVNLELPQWQLRRIAYDGGEWHCAVSRQRELPDWLDQSVEASHSDLALAILSAVVEAKNVAASADKPSVPSVRRRLMSYPALL
jgi:hypothetical protein